MGLELEQIRALADRVAASHGLDVVDLEYLGGGGKHRTLRVYIEKDEAERAKLRERVRRLQAERSGAAGGELDAETDTDADTDTDPDTGSEAANAEAGENEAGDAETDGDEETSVEQWEQDGAFLDGLPSVSNLELLSGITHEDCEVFSRDFGTVLDVEELVPGTEYLLEVSSPGLDRRLAGRKDFERFTGSLAKIETLEAVEGNRHWLGRIAEVEAERLVLELVQAKSKGKAKKGQPRTAHVELALSNVAQAQLVPEF